MVANYIKISVRKLRKHKANSFTKLFSLSIGLVSLFYISTYLQQELSFDDFHQKRSDIYKLNTTGESPTGTLELGLSATPAGAYLSSASPEVKEYVRIYKEYGSRAIRYGEKLFSESENIYYADANFFNVFDFELLSGNRKTALDGPDKVIISERTARKYFGTLDVLNRTLDYDGAPFVVSGVVANVPSNSHLQFDFLVSLATFYSSRPTADQNWTWFPMNTYLLLEQNADLTSFNEKLKSAPAYLPENSSNEKYSLSVEPLSGLHFSEPKLGELGPKGKLSDLYVLFAIGVMVLLLAVSNFINLTTAQVSLQGKEVSVKKTMGASRKNILSQFLTESLLLITTATILSVLVTLVSFSYFEAFMERTFDLSFLTNPAVLAVIASTPLILTLLGGIYPALKFANISALHQSKSEVPSTSLLNTRTSLLVFQFAITSTLIISSLLIYRQLNFVQNRDIGLDTEQKVVIDYGPNGQIGNAFESIKTTLSSVPGVESVTFSSHVPGQQPNGTTTIMTDTEGQVRNGEINLNLVDHDFIKNYGLQMVAGRDFRTGPADNNTALILNEAAVKAFGYDNPEDIIGASFTQWGGNGKVVGVVSDFNYLSLHQDVGLLSLKMWPDQYQKITLEITQSRVKNTLEDLESKWYSLYPNVPFKYYFVDDNFKAQYSKDQQFSMIINIFTIVSVLIGILGLVAYATFWCNGRKKEISIRKVLGAEAGLLLWNLFKGFSLPVVIGFAFAIPTSYYFGNSWLEQFAYQINFNWTIFALPIVILFVFVAIAVGTQSIKLVLTNPVDNLKDQ
ncbi:MAG: ABC transporter permease [Cyclobacteriaceae bacterium]